MNATPTTSLVTANNGGSEADTTNLCPFHQPKPVQWDATPAWIDIDNWDLAPFTGPTKATAPSFDVTEDSWRHQLSDDIVARRETEEKSGWHSRATEDASAWGVGRLEFDGHRGFGFNPFASDDDEETARISSYPSSTYPSPDASSPTTCPTTPTRGRYSSLSLGGVPLAHLNCDTSSGSRGPASKAKAQYGPITRPTKKSLQRRRSAKYLPMEERPPWNSDIQVSQRNSPEVDDLATLLSNIFDNQGGFHLSV